MATVACTTMTPPLCGPIMNPGSWDAKAVEARALEHASKVPLLIELPGRTPTLVCVSPKGGSTSFFYWLYNLLAGEPFEFPGPPWVHEWTSSRWTSNVRARLTHLDALSAQQRSSVLDDPSVLRFALIRRPVERVVSAFWSKAACNGSDADRRIIVQSLAETGPTAASSVALAYGVDDVTGLECLDGIEDLITMLEEARNGGRLGRIDEHFRPQTDICQFDAIGYHHLIPIESAHHPGLEELAAALGKPYAPFPQKHSTPTSQTQSYEPAVKSGIERLYADDLSRLPYDDEVNCTACARWRPLPPVPALPPLAPPPAIPPNFSPP